MYSTNKFAVFSGFLGAGKTTAMMALTAYDAGRIVPFCAEYLTPYLPPASRHSIS